MSGPVDLKLTIRGMHCSGCVAGIESSLRQLDGVISAEVNLVTSQGRVRHDRARIEKGKIIERIESLGYGADEGETDLLYSLTASVDKARRQFLIAASATFPLLILAMLPMLTGKKLLDPVADGIVQGILTIVIFVLGGRQIFADALAQAKHLRTNMNTLIAIGTLAAVGWSIVLLWRAYSASSHHAHYYFESAAMIITLVLLGRYIESRTKRASGEAIRALLSLQPNSATIIVIDQEVSIDTSLLKPGMQLLIRPGERIPVDAVVSDGYSAVDESAVTGESLPVDRRLGDPLVGGSLNGSFALRAIVSAGITESFPARMSRFVAEAQAKKPRIQDRADRIAGHFVPAVLLVALVTGVLWFLFSDNYSQLVESVIAVLVIACPCALGLATPTAVLAGSMRAARSGVLFRGGDAIESLASVDTILLDKTGTVTRGNIEVKEVRSYSSIAENEVLALASAVERNSEHLLARAVVTMATERGVLRLSAIQPTILPGMGVTGKVAEDQIGVGNRRLMEKLGVDISASYHDCLEDLGKSRTVIYVSSNGKLAGVITCSDTVRTESVDVTRWLKKRVNRVMLVSGDSYKTVRGVADTLAIDHIAYETTPEQKREIVQTLERAGMKVAMVGDGINDAPALAEATAGIAMGSGTDIAKESSHTVLLGGNLRLLVYALEMAGRTVATIKQNFFWAFAYNVVAIPIAAGALYPLFGWSLSPWIAAAAMSFSSLSVVLNSARLTRYPLAEKTL